MYKSPIGSLLFGLMLVLCCAIAVSSASADSLVARIHKESLLLYEPLVVEVTLHLEEPFLPGTDNAHERLEQLRRLRRRFVADVHKEESRLLRVPLSSSEFIPTSEPTSVFQTNVLGFIAKADKQGKSFTFPEGAGTYSIVVQDLENRLTAKPVLLTIIDPSPDIIDAAELFRNCIPDILVAMLKQGGSRNTTVHFQRLANEFPNTPYGKYAAAALALINYKKTSAEHNIKGGAEVWIPVTVELKKAASLFTGKHPLREITLSKLANAYLLAGDHPNARDTARTIIADFPNSKPAKDAAKLLNELQRKQNSNAPE